MKAAKAVGVSRTLGLRFGCGHGGNERRMIDDALQAEVTRGSDASTQ